MILEVWNIYRKEKYASVVVLRIQSVITQDIA